MLQALPQIRKRSSTRLLFFGNCTISILLYANDGSFGRCASVDFLYNGLAGHVVSGIRR